MTWSVSSCFITLVVLFLWRIEDIAEACKCAPVHLQQAFCNADVGKAILAIFLTSQVLNSGPRVTQTVHIFIVALDKNT